MVQWYSDFGHVIGSAKMHSNHCGDTMTTKTRPRFNPEFKVECAQLVLDRRYFIREAVDAMNVGHSTLDKWVRKLKAERAGSVTAGKPITEEQREMAKLKNALNASKWRRTY